MLSVQDTRRLMLILETLFFGRTFNNQAGLFRDRTD